MTAKQDKPKKKRISVQSAKGKGRNLVKDVKASVLKTFPFLHDDDLKVTSSGAGGEDLQLSPAARRVLPISIECKNQERMNLWASWGQATANSKGYNPVLIFKKNHQKPLVVLTLDYFLDIHKDCDSLAKLVEKNKDKNNG